MDWSKYSALKSGSKVSFGKEKQVMREAVDEEKDDDGNVVVHGQEKEEREYVALSQKRWDGESGEALDDSKREFSLSDLEREKSRFDSDIAKAQAQSDGLKAAIADFKKV